jgi:hypothetical protein
LRGTVTVSCKNVLVFARKNIFRRELKHFSPECKKFLWNRRFSRQDAINCAVAYLQPELSVFPGKADISVFVFRGLGAWGLGWCSGGEAGRGASSVVDVLAGKPWEVAAGSFDPTAFRVSF